jgi:hypothetical protein
VPSTGTIGYRYRFTAPLVEGFTNNIAQRVDEFGLTDALVETDNALGSPMSIEVRTKEEAALVRMLLGDEQYAIHTQDAEGRTHSFNDEPAVTAPGMLSWFNEGARHRTNGPAMFLFLKGATLPLYYLDDERLEEDEWRRRVARMPKAPS